MKKALIAMSGGVDSSVAAYLALKAGYDCIGVTMHLQGNKDAMDAQARDAKAVADRLGIPFQVLDFQAQFRAHVMDAFVRSYENGLTPNPCVVCNRYLKFGGLLEAAAAMGCDAIVTGHYAQIFYNPESGRYAIKKAVDEGKDQSYFLYALSQAQLSRIQFPLGSLSKAQAREIALEQGFLTAKKKDSQDICFIPDGDYLSFMTAYTGKTYPCGNFLDMGGNVVGQHKGAVGYTLGQRKGLGLAMGEPVYVCGKDMQANTVTVGTNASLMRQALRATDWFWHTIKELKEPIRVQAKARSRMSAQNATVYPEKNGDARVVFDEPQRALTPGQAVVLYDGDIVVGGGTITEIL